MVSSCSNQTLFEGPADLLTIFSIYVVENSLTYSLTGGNVANAFEVVPELGEIKVRRQLDYEGGPRVGTTYIKHLSTFFRSFLTRDGIVHYLVLACGSTAIRTVLS